MRERSLKMEYNLESKNDKERQEWERLTCDAGRGHGHGIS